MLTKKVLFVTNAPEAAARWREVMSGSGFVVDVALSGNEALDRAASGSPDLVILDAIETAPEVIAASFRERASTAAIPLFILTKEEAGAPELALPKIESILARRRVLVAEDDRQMAEIIAMILKKNGFEVRLAYDGVETLKAVKDYRPHLLVLDVMLPLVDGFHICQTMNEDHSFEPRPRVLIVSGRSSDWDQNLGAACGADGYVVKPFNNAEFVRKVNEVLALG